MMRVGGKTSTGVLVGIALQRSFIPRSFRYAGIGEASLGRRKSFNDGLLTREVRMH